MTTHPIVDRSKADFDIWAEILDLNMREELQEQANLSPGEAHAAFRLALQKTAADLSVGLGATTQVPTPQGSEARRSQGSKAPTPRRPVVPIVMTIIGASALFLMSCSAVASA